LPVRQLDHIPSAGAGAIAVDSPFRFHPLFRPEETDNALKGKAGNGGAVWFDALQGAGHVAAWPQLVLRSLPQKTETSLRANSSDAIRSFPEGLRWGNGQFASSMDMVFTECEADNGPWFVGISCPPIPSSTRSSHLLKSRMRKPV
jgi:hypothetical protein